MQENFTFLALLGTAAMGAFCFSGAIVFMYFIANYGTATQKTLLKLIAAQRTAQAAPASTKALSSGQVVRLQQGISDIIGQQITLAAEALAELSAPEKIRHVEQIETHSAMYKYVIQIQQTESLRHQLGAMVQGLMAEFEKQGQTTEVPEEIIIETLEAMKQYQEI